MRRFKITSGFMAALLSLVLAGCASMQAIDVQEAMRYPPPPGVDIGSLVEVRTLAGREMKFRVTEVNILGLDGKYGFVAYEDMDRLKVEKPPNKDSNLASYILGALGVIALIALVDDADAVVVCSDPPCLNRPEER